MGDTVSELSTQPRPRAVHREVCRRKDTMVVYSKTVQVTVSELSTWPQPRTPNVAL